MNEEKVLRKIGRLYLDWYNADLDEDEEAADTLYKIGEVLKKAKIL